VNETPIVGEPHEIQASIDRVDAAAPATASGHLPPEAVAVERKGGATPTVGHSLPLSLRSLLRPPTPTPNRLGNRTRLGNSNRTPLGVLEKEARNDD
jgi:hypothetical protein